MMTPREVDQLATAIAEKLRAESGETTQRRLLDLEEIAVYLGVSPNTVRNHELPCFRIGARLKYDPVKVMEALEAMSEWEAKYYRLQGMCVGFLVTAGRGDLVERLYDLVTEHLERN